MSEASGRDAILGSIRRSLGRGPLDETARAELDERLAKPEPNIVPARTDISREDRVALFTSMAESVFATVDRVSGPDAVPGAVTDYLAGQNLPPSLVMAPDPALDDYPWADRPMLAIRRGAAEEADRVAVTGAVMGFAETGTLMMASGPDHPSTLNFLPETHVVVLPAERLRGGLGETASGRRGRHGRWLHAAHGQPRHRPLAHRRHRADHHARRPRPAPAAHRHRGRR